MRTRYRTKMEWLQHIRRKFLRHRQYKVERAISRLHASQVNADALLAEMAE